jgi:hypothetical protein
MDRFLSLNKVHVYGHPIPSDASPRSLVPGGAGVLTKIIAFIVLLSGASMLHAQASPTASRTGDLKIGGGFTNAGGFKDACGFTNADGLSILCGSTTAGDNYISERANGGMGYINFDFKPHLGIEGNFHFVKDGASDVYQKTYEVGPRYYRTYGRWVPYGKLLYGRGVFNFAIDGTAYDNLAYNLIAAGVGVDYKALSHLYVRGDFEYQNWFGFSPCPFPSSQCSSQVNVNLRPTLLTIGAAYHF